MYPWVISRNMTNDMKLLAWVLRGSQRRVILKVMDKPMIPAQIYEKAVVHNKKITRNSVSDVLREFRKKRLVVCINPEEKKGRIYRLTQKGKQIRKKL